MEPTFLTDAINRLIELQPKIATDNDQRQFIDPKFREILLPDYTSPEPIGFLTLSGLIRFIKEDLADRKDLCFVHVYSDREVFLYGSINPDNFNKRFCYAKAENKISGFQFSSHQSPYWHDLEAFIIQLQGLFVKTESIDNMISMLGHLANETILEKKDDGFSQQINIKTGITTKSQIKVENPIELQPYRTFREVAQPASNFILRLKNKDGFSCALFEGDGGAWRLQAIKNITEHLELALVNSGIPIVA